MKIQLVCETICQKLRLFAREFASLLHFKLAIKSLFRQFKKRGANLGPPEWDQAPVALQGLNQKLPCSV